MITNKSTDKMGAHAVLDEPNENLEIKSRGYKRFKPYNTIQYNSYRLIMLQLPTEH